MSSGRRYWSRIGRFALGLGFLSACHLSPSVQPTAIQPLGGNQVQTALPATEERSSDGRRWVYAKLDEKAASYHLLDGECPPDPYGRPVVVDNVNYDIWRYGGPESGDPNLPCGYELGANSGGTARWVGFWTSRTVLAVYRRQIFFTDAPDVWYYLGTRTYAPLPGESPDPNPSSDPSPSPSDSPTPSEPPTPSPVPSQNPSSPPSSSPSSLPSSDPFPSSNPSPTEPPCYADFRAQEGFSPNGDGKFDQLSIEVSSGCAWVISVDGRSGVVKSGKGDMSFSWDGSLGNRQKPLPDGKYTLRLKIGSGKGRLEKTAEIILDTKGPEVEEVLFDGVKKKLIGTVVPNIKIRIEDRLSGVSDAKDLKLKFSKRLDGVVPVVDDGSKTVSKVSSGSYEATYNVPFKEESILYCGDQTLDIMVSDALGNIGEHQVLFAVGDHSLYSGGGTGNAYRVDQSDEGNGSYRVQDVPGMDYPLAEKAAEMVRNGAIAIKVKRVLFLRDAAPVASRAVNNTLYIVRASSGALAGVTFFVFYDDIYNRVKDFIDRDRDTVYTDTLGSIEIPDKRVGHIKKGHPEVTREIIDDILIGIKDGTRKRGDFEVWESTDATGPNGTKELMVVCKIDGKIYSLILHDQGGGGLPRLEVETGWGAACYNGVWPSPKYQWGQIVQKVSEFDKKDNPYGLWKVSSRKPKFRIYRFGEIPDDKVKPYIIMKSRPYTDRGLARKDREIPLPDDLFKGAS